MDKRAKPELAEWPADIRARLARIIDLIKGFGSNKVGMPDVRNIDGKLWGMRAKGRDGIARALYFMATGRRVTIVRAFVKKTQKAPRREFNIAKERMNTSRTSVVRLESGRDLAAGRPERSFPY